MTQSSQESKLHTILLVLIPQNKLNRKNNVLKTLSELENKIINFYYLTKGWRTAEGSVELT